MSTAKFKEGDKVTVTDDKHPNAGCKAEVVAVFTPEGKPVRCDCRSLPGIHAGGKHEFSAEEKQLAAS